MPSVTSRPRTCSGSPGAGYVEGISIVDADVLEGRVLLTVDEIDRRRHVEVFDVDARRGMPDADQLFRMGIGQRLEQHAFNRR